MRGTAVIEPSQTLVGANQIAKILKPALLNYKMLPLTCRVCACVDISTEQILTFAPAVPGGLFLLTPLTVRVSFCTTADTYRLLFQYVASTYVRTVIVFHVFPDRLKGNVLLPFVQPTALLKLPVTERCQQHPEDTASCHAQFPVMAGMSWSNSGTARFKLDRDCATMAGPNTHYNELSWTKRGLDDREGVHRKNFCGEPRVDHFQPKVLGGIRIESPGAAVSTKKEHIYFLCQTR